MSEQAPRPITLDLPAALLQQLEQAADAAGRTLSEHINGLLRDAIEEMQD